MTGASRQPPPPPPGADSPKDFVQRAMVLYGQKRLQEVVKVCRLGLLADPRRLDGRLVLGRALMALCNYDDVLAEASAILQQDPDNYRALMLKAESLVRMKDYVQAREVLMHVEDLDPFNHQASQLLDYLDDELERAGGPVAHVTTNTRQYPASKAKEITTKDVTVTPETGKFLEQSTAEALRDLSTRDGQEGDGAADEQGGLADAPAEGDLGDEGWEEEESTLMDMAPSFEQVEDTPLQESATWDGQPGSRGHSLRTSATWEGAITGAGEVTGAGPLDAQPTLEDDGLLEEWSGGGEVEGLEPTITDGGGTAWDGGGQVEEKEVTVTEGEDAAWDGGGEVESMEPTVTEGEPKTSK